LKEYSSGQKGAYSAKFQELFGRPYADLSGESEIDKEDFDEEF
jgi:hypothetical protein